MLRLICHSIRSNKDELYIFKIFLKVVHQISGNQKTLNYRQTLFKNRWKHCFRLPFVTRFFDCHLSPDWRQMAIKNTVSSDFHMHKTTCICNMLLSDFINLTHVHNFTVSAQDIFTFRRLSVFTVSFTGILQLLMQIMKRFVPSY